MPRITKFFQIGIIGLSVIGFFAPLLGDGSEEALAVSHKGVHKFDPELIRFCVNQLLYEDTFPNGDPVGDRTIIDPRSAARACKGVVSEKEVVEVKRCINGLLYDRTFSDGSPVGERTIIDPASAAQACQICKDYD